MVSFDSYQSLRTQCRNLKLIAWDMKDLLPILPVHDESSDKMGTQSSKLNEY